MGLRFPNQKNYQCFFVTTTFKDWQPFGNMTGIYGALEDSVIFYSEKYKALIAGYVFMPSHIHLLIFIEGKELSNYMRDFKKFISQKAIKEVGIRESNVWMPRYDKVVIENENVFRTKLNYIHNNPVNSNLARKSVEWKWSSARDYLDNKKGKIPIWKDWA